jgi:predicted nucleotidyltransferase
VWLFALFSSILTYEFAKALKHHPGTTKAALFGSVARSLSKGAMGSDVFKPKA